MKVKVFTSIITTLTLVAPLAAFATSSTTVQVGLRAKINRPAIIEDRANIKILEGERREGKRETVAAMKGATSSAEKKELRAGWKDEREATTTAIKNLRQDIRRNQLHGLLVSTGNRITNGINQIKNAIERLRDRPNSIIPKLDSRGGDTTLIKKALTEADGFATAATKQFAEAKLQTEVLFGASATTSSTTITASQYQSLRLSYQSAITSLRAAQTKVTEAIKLIREIPNINSILSATSTVTVVATTTSTTTP